MSMEHRPSPADDEPSVNRRFYLPRLKEQAYQGHAMVHWTLTMERRASGWLTPAFHAAFRELMLHTAARQHLMCPTYCLMPDHIHLVWMGLRSLSDQRAGMAFLRTHLKQTLRPAKFQHQAHDHVLRREERLQGEFANACNYVLENPIRAGLVSDAREWEFTGAIVPGYPTFHPLDDWFWGLFWKVFWMQRHDETRGPASQQEPGAAGSSRR